MIYFNITFLYNYFVFLLGFFEVETGYQCGTCGKICKYKNTIKRHIIDQHTESNSALQCVFCLKIYKNKNSLDQHRYKDHREQVMTAF